MGHRRVLPRLVVMALLVTACGATPVPSPSAPGASTAPGESADPGPSLPIAEPSSVMIDQIVGAWRPDSIDLEEGQIAIVSDACAAAARELLGEEEADLPTALVDARGEGFATAILADEVSAIECLARTDGRTANVDGVFRLSQTAVLAVDETKVTVARLVQEEDRDGGRTVAFGRVGPVPFGVKLEFSETDVTASTANGWWAAWWPGGAQAIAIEAVDQGSSAVGSAEPPTTDVEARVGPAAWWLDPTAEAPTAASTTIAAVVIEEACASGHSPEGRIELPQMEFTATEVIVTFSIRRRPGGQDCQGNAPFKVQFELPEPLGSRTLLDGGEDPPRKAGEPPVG
ncbi:MAG TPA: hypothetical protein VFK35_10530 [Candidatus Limnocylindrales bacterium]|nr:hypothetical protein [Candidatus Limnocylindrales bacterium]